jgi:hypothetical protein
LWRALSRIKGRDLVLVFAGLFCLLVIVSLATHKIGSARKQKELAHSRLLKHSVCKRSSSAGRQRRRRSAADASNSNTSNTQAFAVSNTPLLPLIRSAT